MLEGTPAASENRERKYYFYDLRTAGTIPGTPLGMKALTTIKSKEVKRLA
jgi:hypothetical protein